MDPCPSHSHPRPLNLSASSCKVQNEAAVVDGSEESRWNETIQCSPKPCFRKSWEWDKKKKKASGRTW
jgi:hypothetical protein